MAYKKYAYYNKGNKIALIQQSESTSSGTLAVAHCTISGYSTKDTCEAAGGQWIPSSSSNMDTVGEYKSPIENVAKGLEIEYTYAPIYNATIVGDHIADTHRFIGWGSDGDNLVLFTYGTTGVENISSLFSADQWIMISGGQWSGLHKVKSASTEGILTTYTKCKLPWSKLEGITVTFATDETISSASRAKDFEVIKDLETRSAPYIFIGGDIVSGSNAGIYKITLDTADTTGAKLGTVTSKYLKNFSTGVFEESAASLGAGVDDADIDIHNLVYDEMFVHEGIEVLEDETFELDLTRYQANAVVYYLQAKKFEDVGDLEKCQYYMRQFKKQLEKGANSRKYGPNIIQSHWSIK
jgi:hypothetical protein